MLRTFVSLLDQKERFSNEMHARKVKKVMITFWIILEMYQVTVENMKKHLCDVINDSVVPMLHVNLDLRTYCTSHEKYIGIRVFFANNQ